MWKTLGNDADGNFMELLTPRLVLPSCIVEVSKVAASSFGAKGIATARLRS